MNEYLRLIGLAIIDIPISAWLSFVVLKVFDHCVSSKKVIQFAALLWFVTVSISMILIFLIYP